MAEKKMNCLALKLRWWDIGNEWVTRKRSALESELCPDPSFIHLLWMLCFCSLQQPASSLSERGAPARLPLTSWLPLLFVNVLLHEVCCVCFPTAECPEWATAAQISIVTPQHYLLYMYHSCVAASVKRINPYCPCLVCSPLFPLLCELAWFITGKSISGSISGRFFLTPGLSQPDHCSEVAQLKGHNPALR